MTEPQDQPAPRKRRPRYSGTHPRRFEQRYKELDPRKYPQMQEHIRQQGRTPAGAHVPIMVAEALAALEPAPGEIVCDCTLGYGGHAQAFLERIGPAGRLVGLDMDGRQLARTRERLAGLGMTLAAHHSNFAGLGKALAAEGLAGCDVIFADLGVSSMQLDDPQRGFSYRGDGPLDMRMDERTVLSAADLLARLSEPELSEALRDLADESDHDKIAAAIVARRTQGPIARTGELVEIVLAAKGLAPAQWKKLKAQNPGLLHPAALTFQALRILVNDELGSLRALLRTAPFCLRPLGRIGILSFHSGEDRLVKKAFREGLQAGLYSAVSDEVIRPGPEEVRNNPRSSPAKLRWARRAP